VKSNLSLSCDAMRDSFSLASASTSAFPLGDNYSGVILIEIAKNKQGVSL
jgi:hypothetical protein